MSDEHPITVHQWIAAISQLDLLPTVHHVGLMLASYADFASGFNARPGEPRLAADTGLAQRTIRKALHLLGPRGECVQTHDGARRHVHVGAIEITARGWGNQHGVSANVYRLRWPDGEATVLTSHPALIAGSGTPMPIAASGSGIPVPEPDRGTGTTVPAAGRSGNPRYRHLATEVPAPHDRGTGTAVPPTSQTTHYQPTKPPVPTGSAARVRPPVSADEVRLNAAHIRADLAARREAADLEKGAATTGTGADTGPPPASMSPGPQGAPTSGSPTRTGSAR